MRIFPKVSADIKSWVGAGLIRGWMSTLRFRFIIDDDRTVPHLAPRPVIYVFWHEMLLLPAYTHTGVATPLISRGTDGDVIDRVVQRFGGRAIRGATDHSGKDRGGRAALRTMIRSGEAGHLAIPMDGPVGPRRVVGHGTVVLASHTGMPIVPIGMAVGAGLLVGPRAMPVTIPMPWTRAWMVAGKAIEVPPDLSRRDRGRHAARVQAGIDEVQARAERLAKGEAPAVSPLTLGEVRRLAQPAPANPGG